MDLLNFDFDLPKNLIASRPLNPRSCAKLLYYDNSVIKDLKFINLPDLLNKNDLLVFNNTKVLPALLFGYDKNKKIGFGNKKYEFLLINQIDKKKWFCICKSLKKIEIGIDVFFSSELSAKVIKIKETGLILEFVFKGDFFDHLNKIGFMPIPPYIRKIREVDILDHKDYQPIFSDKIGSIASPTASLHFDRKLLKNLKGKDIKFCFITLHVGIGTFTPIRVRNIFDHKMHAEYGEINQAAVDEINNSLKSGGRIIPVGTTSLRFLESLKIKKNTVRPFSGYTQIYIKPGFKFKIASGLITNFHLPKSSLFILVAALIGLKNAKKIYSHAIRNNYRFFSYGDGSILIP